MKRTALITLLVSILITCLLYWYDSTHDTSQSADSPGILAVVFLIYTSGIFTVLFGFIAIGSWISRKIRN